eukprot:721007-Amphidinium_carterae.3
MVIHTSKKSATQYQLTHLKKFVMGKRLWRTSAPYEHQSQGAVERFHKTLFAQVHAIRFDLVDHYNGQPDNVPAKLLPWILQHSCFTINRHQACHQSEACNTQSRAEGGRYVDWQDNKQWGAHHRAQLSLKNNGGLIYNTRSLSRMTLDPQWSKELFNTIEVLKMNTMQPDYSEEAVIGKAIINQYFTKVRFNDKQAGHSLWANKKEVRNPPDMHNGENIEQLQPRSAPQGLEPPPQYIHPASKAMATPSAYKPKRLRGPSVAHLDEIATTREIAVENNEDKEEKNHMESLMDNVQVQPWWQYEDD